MKSPALAAIHAAEWKVVAAKQQTLDGVPRAWVAVKSALVRPSSLAAVAVAGFCGGLLLAGSKPKGDAEKKPAATESFASIVMAFAVRYAGRVLPAIVSRIWVEHPRNEPCTVIKTVIHDHDGVTHVS